MSPADAAEVKARRMREWRLANPGESRSQRLKWTYGISLEQYRALLAAQGGGCALCRAASPGGKGDFHVDHDHSCCPGKTSCGECVRGLLCVRCNTALGMFGDDIYLMKEAIAYVSQGRMLERVS